jgi:hypothetical protein
MNTTIIIVLTLILLFLIILNHVSITLSSNNTQQTQWQQNNNQGKCSQTAYGCCPDGVNSKIDFNGTNCPAYNPGPGYRV